MRRREKNPHAFRLRSVNYSHDQLVVDIHYKDKPPNRTADRSLWFLYYRAARTDQLGTLLSKSFTICSLEQEILAARNKAELLLGGDLAFLQYVLNAGPIESGDL